MDDATQSSCKLVLEWAQKLFPDKCNFDKIQSLALHLIHDRLVSTRSPAAFTVLASANNVETGSESVDTTPKIEGSTSKLSNIKQKPSLTVNCNGVFSTDSVTTSFKYCNGSTESVSAPTTPVKGR